MANVITPQLYTSYLNPDKVDITPKFFASYLDPASVKVKPLLFVSYEEPTTIYEESTCYINRKALVNESSESDIKREIHGQLINETEANDTSRKVLIFESSLADIKRQVTNDETETSNADILRKILVVERPINDISRNVVTSVNQSAILDISRKVTAPESSTVDIRREIRSQGVFETGNADISLKTLAFESGKVDTSFEVTRIETSKASIRRIIPKQIVIPPNPPANPPTAGTDEEGNTVYTFGALAQTPGLTSINLKIQERNLTDEISFGMAGQDVALQDCFAGTYLDYDYRMHVERIDQSGIQLTATCKYDVDFLVNKLIDYKENEYDAIDHLQYIARKTNLSLYYNFDSFELANNISGELSTTFQSVIESLFSWTGNLPYKLVNVFIRKDTIYAIQRGRERNTVNIDDLIANSKSVTKPEFVKELVRTDYIDTDFIRDLRYNTWMDRGSEWIVPLSTYDEILNPGEEHELHTSGNSYDSDGNIIKKTTTNKDGSKTVIEYSYTYKNGRKYLSKETETHYDEHGDKDRTNVTEYEYQGAGQYSATRFEDEEYSGAAVGYGKGSNDISDYQKRQDAKAITWWKYGHTLSAEDKEKYESICERIRSLFPLKEREDHLINGIDERLIDLADEYNNLNLKTQETINLTIYNYSHVIGFDDKIIYNNNTYYLVSNDVYKDTRVTNRQSITAVRWY